MRLLTNLALATLLTALGPAAIHGQDQTVYAPGDGVTLPTVVERISPSYTAEAMRRQIQGSVTLSSVVLADGSVGEVRVTSSLDAETGLDQAAIDAMKQWRFKPGTKEGTPVAVRVECEMTFTLK